MGTLEGQTAVVTGGAKGIGKAIVLGLAGHGCDVVVSDVDTESAEATAKEAENMGVRSLAVKVDVSNSAEVENMLKTALEIFGKVDILINNAGITRDNLLMRMSEEEWDSVLNVNLKGAFNCTKSVIRTMMKQRSGKIINVVSVVGVAGNAGQANYAASKAGLIGFTKSIARETASRNIQVNAIAPGYIETDMTVDLSDEVKKAFLDSVPMRRAGRPEDVASLALFLASPAADYITGQIIHVDGGMVMF